MNYRKTLRGFARRAGRPAPGLATILIPTLAAAVYFGLIAAPRYVSEAQFVVRGATTSRLTGLQSLFRSIGVTRTVDDANIVQQYILSRDAAEAMEKKDRLRSFFARPDGDILSRYPRFWESAAFEHLYDHYLDRVAVVHDTTRGILTLRVETFRAEDSRALAEGLLGLAEGMVNQMNERAVADALGAALGELNLAEEKVIDAQLSLTRFRNEGALVDPNKNSTAALETISSLSTELSQVQATIAQLQRTAPASPSIEVANARVTALRSRIQAERRQLAGDEQSLAVKVSAYERLTLMRDLADKRFGAAVLALENARAEARRQQVYVERIAGPTLPDHPDEPRRLRSVFAVFLVCAMGQAVFWILSVGAREHGQDIAGESA